MNSFKHSSFILYLCDTVCYWYWSSAILFQLYGNFTSSWVSTSFVFLKIKPALSTLYAVLNILCKKKKNGTMWYLIVKAVHTNINVYVSCDVHSSGLWGNHRLEKRPCCIKSVAAAVRSYSGNNAATGFAYDLYIFLHEPDHDR